MKIVAVRLLLLTLALGLALTPPATAQLDHAEVLVGSVEIQVFSGHGIGVTVDEVPQDGIAEAVFVLQANALIPPELPAHMRTARVTFEGERLLIVSLEESFAAGLFLYEVDASDVEQRLRGHLGQRHRGATPRVFLHGGHGLSRHKGRFPLPIETWPPAEDSGALQTEAFGDATTQSAGCDAGGPGSTSCSVSCGGTNHGCSVTCASGYYACCDCGFLVSSCTCVSDGSGGSSGGGGGGGGDDSCEGGGYCPPECMSCDPNAY